MESFNGVTLVVLRPPKTEMDAQLIVKLLHHVRCELFFIVCVKGFGIPPAPFTQVTSVSEWKYIIPSAFKFKLLRQPEAAGCSPAHNGHGYSQLGGN